MGTQRFSQLTAVERAAALVDPGTLALLPSAPAPYPTAVVARGIVEGRTVLLALTDGRQRGGTIGLAEAGLFSQALAIAERRRWALVFCWDTGGVRVQEGPAALAATSAIGVGLARATLLGIPAVHLISGPRGCFGAPAVVAALGHGTVLARNALWGLTGPQLLEGTTEASARAAMAAAARHGLGLARAVDDDAAAIRRELARRLAIPIRRIGPRRHLERLSARAARLAPHLPPQPPGNPPARRRRRDFFAYSFRHRWQPTGPILHRGPVQAAWGRLGDGAAMAIIVGPERPQEGVGSAVAQAVLEAVRLAVVRSHGAPAPIVTFLFCRGHATSIDEERAGLPAALAACLEGLVTARLLGHPLVCVLGGGAYGAAYLTLAAPSHRVLAIRGTAVAPMAPRVLAAFQRLRGLREAAETPADLARMIPEIRIVESIVRLPRVLGEELEVAARAAAQAPPVCRVTVTSSGRAG